MSSKLNNRYYIMRHGESIANRKGIIVSEPEDALNNYGLTALGADQVLNSALKNRLKQNLLIASSDYLRARESAQILQNIICTESPIKYFTELRERSFGDWDLSADSNYDIVWQNDLQHPNITLHQVETVNQVLARSLHVIDQLESNHHDCKILLVGHGDVLQILLTYFKGIEVRLHRSLPSIKNAEIRRLPC